jgi:lipid-A-disaccharide synthase
LVVAYRTGRISFALAKRLVKVTNIGLVNVVAGREVAEEFIQDEIVPAKIAAVLEQLLDMKSPQRHYVLTGLAEVRAKLGTPGAAERVAAMASKLAGDG